MQTAVFRAVKPIGLSGMQVARFQCASPSVSVHLSVQKWVMSSVRAPPPSTPDLSAQPAVASLYRAAVGPLGADYYAAVFERFEIAGRSRPSWNWAAALLTLNWLLFRQLWLAALAWGAVLLLLPLLLLGLGRVVFALPLPVELGLWLSFVVLSVVLPGAWGNALFYAQCQRRIAVALAARPTLEEAWRVLSQQASASKHRAGLALVNALVLGAAVWGYVSLPDTAPLAEPASAPVAAPAVAHVSPATTASGVAKAVSAVAVPALPAAALSATAAVAVVDEVSASVAASNATDAMRRASRRASADYRPAPPALAVSAAVKPLPQASTGQLFVNVGLFANAANAQRAQARLVAAGLPAISQVVPTGNGDRTRLRAGPFASRTQAQLAVKQIHALQLDAVLAP